VRDTPFTSDFNDEMELVNKAEEIKDEKDDFYATQESFE
jgi:hypothetical protein